eukprot:TRINITY_DN8254_c1_g1_i1.p1 TRINITY_DN8254_c1_g1~~TRINITY_DN8254_c1_g1_i1.p1  ORF type:complete len:135 (-),score=17.58 TRINITY_DN8254_c1_g1_i1:182-553(-)
MGPNITQILTPLLCLMITISSAGIAKRDTIDDLGESIGDALGINKKGIIEQIEDIDKTKYCIQDNGCFEPLQYCEKGTYQLYGTCSFYIWLWLAAASLVGVFFFSCITTILCCFCSCCRKAAS